MKTHTAMKTIRQTFLGLAAALVPLLASSAHAGTWSYSAWTDDSTSGISPTSTQWAYHFASTQTATVNGVTVPGRFQGVSDGNVDVNGYPTSLYGGADNNLTALGGTGSALIAQSFNYNGVGGSMYVTAKGLTAGNRYVLSFYGVGFDGPPNYLPRAVSFASGGDFATVDQNTFGYRNGIRVDYSFTATASVQDVTLTETALYQSWGLNAVALNTVANDLAVGTTVADVPGATIATLYPAHTCETGTLYLKSTLKGVPATANACILSWDNSTANTVVREGDLLDGEPLASFGDPIAIEGAPGDVFVNFSAKLKVNGTSVTATNDEKTAFQTTAGSAARRIKSLQKQAQSLGFLAISSG